MILILLKPYYLQLKRFFQILTVSELLNICNVHCLAKKMVNKVMDWYEILQVDIAADETVIKRQYRKLAMLLHPDKNKFTGAEAAFKLVAEANSVLRDGTKRSEYDMRRNNASRMAPSVDSQQQGKRAKTSSEPGSVGSTFWTICPECHTRHQYYTYVLHEMVQCQDCKIFFPASRLTSPVKPSIKKKNMSRRISDHDCPKVAERQKSHTHSASIVSVSAGSSMNVKGNLSLESNSKKSQNQNFPWTCVEGIDVAEATTDSEATSDHYNTMAECSTQTEARGDEHITMAEATRTVGKKQHCYSKGLSTPYPGVNVRDVNNMFKGSGQIWALYDNYDGMPRMYAQIKGIDEANSRVHLNWMKYVVRKKGGRKRSGKGQTIACGKFLLGKRDILEDSTRFSHIVEWKNDKRSKFCIIYPNEGEVWALYKRWNIEWTSNDHKHEYEVVQLLSNMSVNGGATVIPLVRIMGFASLFAEAKDKSPFDIPSTELHRFSHRIPFYITNGNERDIPRKEVSSSGTKEHVPGGFLQLDTLCLPANLDEALCSVTLDSYMSSI